MESADIELVRRAVALNRSGPAEETLEPALAMAHPDWVFVSRFTSVEGGAYRGHEGARRYYADCADAFEEWSNRVVAIEELAPGLIYAEVDFRGRARSGVDIGLPGHALFRLSDGQVTGIHIYGSREEALAAAEGG
jgi:hypothetical protein